MVDLSGFDHKSLVERAKAIILTPKDEWPKIAAETTSQRNILVQYAIPLAAIGPVAELIGRAVIGLDIGIATIRFPIVSSVIAAAVNFGIAIAGVYIVAVIANALGPHFGGISSKENSFKLAVYSMTAAWISSIFYIYQPLFFFVILGSYSIYILFTGVSLLMKIPEDKAAGYSALLIISAAIIMAVAHSVSSRIATPSLSSINLSNNSISLPGGVSVQTGKLEELTKRLEGAASGKSPPVEAAKMQALLPGSIGSYQRTASETVGMGQMGSTAEGTYTSGDKTFTLKIVDMSALGALAGIGAAMGVEQSREDADSYEKTGTVDGQMQTESWNKNSNRGKFGMVVGNRFMIEADGQAASLDELKAAVATIDQGNLLSLGG